jgi:hypothetical protein
MRQSRRNVLIEQAVDRALDRVDHFISGAPLALPRPEHRRVIEELLDKQAGSVRTGVLFLMFYWLVEPSWDRESVPIGLRGQFGDKRLSEELSRRHITLHGAITAFGENLGWKGNVREVRLSRDPRFQNFLSQVADATPDERTHISDFLAWRFAESKRESAPLPPVGPDVLTFARAKLLFYQLLDRPSEGHIQQFLVTALLFVLRSRHGIEVRTHHPHAADRYDEAAGDIEEWHDGHLIRAYEVTVREDWKNRISNFKQKMDQFGLSKYIIIALGINNDDGWSVPARMALTLEPYGRDIAVVDIRDVVNFLAAELTANELRTSVNKAYEYLSDLRLSGRSEFKQAYREAVRDWLDSVDSGMSSMTQAQ